MPIDSRCMPSSTLRDSIPNEYQLDQELIISNGVNYAIGDKSSPVAAGKSQKDFKIKFSKKIDNKVRA